MTSDDLLIQNRFRNGGGTWLANRWNLECPQDERTVREAGGSIMALQPNPCPAPEPEPSPPEPETGLPPEEPPVPEPGEPIPRSYLKRTESGFPGFNCGDLNGWVMGPPPKPARPDEDVPPRPGTAPEEPIAPPPAPPQPSPLPEPPPPPEPTEPPMWGYSPLPEVRCRRWRVNSLPSRERWLPGRSRRAPPSLAKTAHSSASWPQDAAIRYQPSPACKEANLQVRPDF